MPYGESAALPGEAASKLGHLTVVNDPLVQDLLSEFNRTLVAGTGAQPLEGDVSMVGDARACDFVVAIDGSVSPIPNTLARHKTLSYVKVAALGLSCRLLERMSGPIVNPDLVEDMLKRGADTFSTVVPLSNVTLPGRDVFESIRAVLQTTFQRFFEGAVYDTLRFLVSREWRPTYEMTAHFQCPFCHRDVALPRSRPDFPCPTCDRALTLVDYLELTSGLSEEGNDERVAMDLMMVLENLLLFHYLRLLVEQELTDRTLLLKDGPLMLPHQYSRLVDPIRDYLAHLRDIGAPVFMAGIEKQQAFVNHIPEIEGRLEDGQVFVPSNHYILTYIKSGSGAGTLYGEKVLYGAKVYYKLDARNCWVLNVPYGPYRTDLSSGDLYGLGQVIATLRRLASRQFQNALLPIVAVNRIASLSVYPSNKILERLAEISIS